ncbi:serine protease [Bosea sp. UNC402CLCol]|uniref:S1 family peptidase n=1 Tax=Bosea sp. UNC402CLCol TaxID=1510531 RepID=UPI0009E0456E|nr:serine protease [Bosea sp. UNC402CLCol]
MLKLFLAALAIFCVSTAVMSQTSLSQLADTVVYIEIKDQDGKKKDHGSGFLIGADGYIVTARHVLNLFDETKDRISVSLKTREGSGYTARKIDCTSPMLDLCLLYISSDSVRSAGISRSVSLSCVAPRAEQGITAAGYPIGNSNPLVMFPGIVSNRGLGELGKIIMSNNIVPGMSGGPIFDENGTVIGVIWGKDSNLGLPMFTPLSHGFALFGMASIACPILAEKAKTDGEEAAVKQSGLDIAKSLEKAAGVNADDIRKSSVALATAEATSVLGGNNSLQKNAEAVSKAIGALASATSSDSKVVKDPSGSPALTSVFFQIADSGQTSAAKEAQQRLEKVASTSDGLKIKVAKGIEQVKAAPSQGEVRYFNDADSATAASVASIVSAQTKFSARKVVLPGRDLSGLLEVWFPKSP